MKRRPDLRVSSRRELETRRQHADDRHRNSAQRNRLTDHVLPRTKPFLPRRITEQHRLCRARLVFAGIEIAAQNRCHAQRPEESCAHSRRRDRLRPRRSAKQITRPGVYLQRSEDPVHPLPVQIVLVREVGAPKGCDRLRRRNQAVRVRIRQWLEQRRIDKGEDRHARANPQRQHQDGH